jgi:poly-gamma-glutamate synthesis protein (capsule biosynthesis protein)
VVTRLAPEPAKIRVLVAGDLLPHRPMLSPPERLRAALEPVAALLSGADMAVANYETATGDPDAILGPHNISLAAPAAWLAAAGEHFHALTLANNHACDLGRPGLEATLRAAHDAGVIALGADDKAPWQPRTLVEKDGHRVCAVAWTTFVNSEARACPGSGKLALAGQGPAGDRVIARAIAAARGAGCDATIAILHGGQEYQTQEWAAQVQARVAADAGADAVVIHHPHVPSPVQLYVTRDGRTVPVFMSVGNLVSNQGESYLPPMAATSPEGLVCMNAWTRLGVVADLEFAWPAPEPAGASSSEAHERPSLAYGYHLTWTENEHATDRRAPMPSITTRPLDPEDPIALRLSRDEAGPTKLFEDPCWLERGVTRCPTPAPRAPRHVDAVARRPLRQGSHGPTAPRL